MQQLRSDDSFEKKARKVFPKIIEQKCFYHELNGI